MAPDRTPEDVRRDIKREREQIGLAVSSLRRGVPRIAGAVLGTVAALKTLKRFRRNVKQ
jgi:hypothetical protein